MQDPWRAAIALCKDYPEAGGVVSKPRDDRFEDVFVRVRNPSEGLLVEHLIRDHRFLVAAETERYDDSTIVLFR
jgi:hypothetical protein